MVARNQLLKLRPTPVEQALTRLGQNLRTARIRRKFTIEEVAEKIGTGRRAVMDAEKGKASTGIGVYAALLWVYDLLRHLRTSRILPRTSKGLTLARAKRKPAPARARGSTVISKASASECFVYITLPGTGISSNGGPIRPGQKRQQATPSGGLSTAAHTWRTKTRLSSIPSNSNSRSGPTRPRNSMASSAPCAMLDPTTGAAASSKSTPAKPSSANWITCWNRPTTARALSASG